MSISNSSKNYNVNNNVNVRGKYNRNQMDKAENLSFLEALDKLDK